MLAQYYIVDICGLRQAAPLAIRVTVQEHTALREDRAVTTSTTPRTGSAKSINYAGFPAKTLLD